MAESVKITIKHDGQVEIEVSGVVGKDCHALTRELQKGLGVTVSDVEKKDGEVKRNETVSNQN